MKVNLFLKPKSQKNKLKPLILGTSLLVLTHSLFSCAPKNEDLKKKVGDAYVNQLMKKNPDAFSTSTPMSEAEYSRFIFVNTERVTQALFYLKTVLNADYAALKGFKLDQLNNGPRGLSSLYLNSTTAATKEVANSNLFFVKQSVSYKVEVLKQDENHNLTELVLSTELNKNLSYSGNYNPAGARKPTDFTTTISFDKFEFRKLNETEFIVSFARIEVANSYEDKKTNIVSQGSFILEWDGSVAALDKTLEVLNIQLFAERTGNKSGVLNVKASDSSTFKVDLTNECIHVNGDLSFDRQSSQVVTAPSPVVSATVSLSSNAREQKVKNPIVVSISDSTFVRQDAPLTSQAQDCATRPALDLTRMLSTRP